MPFKTEYAAVIVFVSATVTTAVPRLPVKVPSSSNAAVTVPALDDNPDKSAANVASSDVTAMLPEPPAAIVSPVTSAAAAVTVTPLSTVADLPFRLPVNVWF